MDDIFVRVFLGHLAGDFLFQTKAMALGKSQKGWRGVSICTIHCLVYTASVCAFMWTANPVIWALVFASHWPIDRWSLGGKWLAAIRGRTFIGAFTSKDPYREFDIAFTSIVYERTDATLHYILLWVITKFFF